jgi:hypothetical protein
MSRRVARTAGMILLKAAFFAIALYPQDQRHASASKQESMHGAVVVELFTSEGCSSCPPADALLRQIDGRETQAGQLIIGISEHVTYWNHLGWSDPFSADTYTQRQDGYAKRFHLDSVFTPQMVIDGEEQIVGNDRAGLEKALLKERNPQPITVHINSINLRGNSLVIDYSVTGIIPAGGADLLALVADDAVQSSVSRGENSGRLLTHVSVARSMTRTGAISLSTSQILQVPLPKSSDASQKKNRHLILIAQAAGLGRVLGVDKKSF